MASMNNEEILTLVKRLVIDGKKIGDIWAESGVIHTVIALALKGEMEKQLLLNNGVVIELSKQ
jgi:hypothetical protein